MKIIIIGGGASGLVCAINAKTENNEVVILEKNNKCGKKLLLTGNGRCNYFNDDFTMEHYHSHNKDILRKIINEDNKQKILSFFYNLGIIPQIHHGYYYPMSNQAITIVNSLETLALRKNIDIIKDVEVQSINYQKQFTLETSKGIFHADKVVLATGSKAYPKTGSDGMGYILAQKFKHHIIKPLPALVQLETLGHYLKEWSGIRTNCTISLWEDDQEIKRVTGEIQLTNYGVSGICVFQLSGLAIRGLDSKHKEELKINFLPWLKESLYDYLETRNKMLGNVSVSTLLDGMLNYKLVNLIIKLSRISSDTYYDVLTNKQKQNLLDNLQNFKVTITGYKDFDQAQVCSGGVKLDEVNILTMESLKQKNLYIIGELLDIDGECGGYNLGIAWLSGILAGEAIKEDYD